MFDVKPLTLPYHSSWVAVLLLFAIVLGVHGFDIPPTWSTDDGELLALAQAYSPWDYFFVPAYVHGVSPAAFITPWLVFVYDFNLALFGLNPVAFYMHQILALAAAVVLTYFFLRLWTDARSAFAAAALFCVSPPAFYIAKQLMNAHYIYGLAFTIGALILFTQGVRKHNWRIAAAGSVLYLLAVNCKEVYLLLPLVLVFLPAGDLRIRLRLATPFFIVFLCYWPWRYAALGTWIGGYHDSAGANDVRAFAELCLRLPALLFGADIIGMLAGSAALIVFLLGLRAGKVNVYFALVALLVLLAPLFPLGRDHVVRAERYFLTLAWALAVGVAVVSASVQRGKAAVWPALILVGGAMFAQGLREREDILHGQASMLQKHYSFLLSRDQHHAILTDYSDIYLNNMLNAAIDTYRSEGMPLAGARVFGFQDIRDGRVPDHLSLWTWSPPCYCLVEISREQARRRGNLLRLDDARSIGFSLAWNEKSRLVTWRGRPYPDGTFTIHFEQWPDLYKIKNENWKRISAKIFWPDGTKPFKFFVRYVSPNGWETRSPSFVLRFNEAPDFAWQR